MHQIRIISQTLKIIQIAKLDVNLRRAWELNYQNGIPGLKTQLKVEDFQTLDKTIKDADKLCPTAAIFY